MRKLAILLLLLPVLSAAQPYAAQRQGTKRTAYEYAGSIIDSVFAIPYRDTITWSALPDSFKYRLTVRPQDKKLYYHNGTKWSAIGSAGLLDSIVKNYGQTGPVVVGSTNSADLRFIVNNAYVGGFDVTNGNTSFGRSVLSGNTGTQVTAFGDFAAAGNTAIAAVAIGKNAMHNNTGLESTGVGYSAGDGNTGSHFTGLGENAGVSNTGDLLTAVGANAAFNNTGVSATAIGNGAGNANTGARLTALGDGAGYNNTVADATLIGYNAIASAANSVALGSHASVTAANCIVLGGVSGVNGAAATSKVGIGVTAPTERLQVGGNLRVDGLIHLSPMSAAAASALTPTNGDIVNVNTTDATFTSAGLWFYTGSAWQQL